MKMSKVEKMILCMLADIHESIGFKGDIDPSFVKKSIESGQIWAIESQYPGLFEQEEVDYEVVKEVMQIMDTWMRIEGFVANLSNTEKTGIKQKVRHDSFVGFDGNNESDHYSTALFLADDLPHRFDYFKGRNLNSHTPMLGYHKEIASNFDRILKAKRGILKISYDEIIEILDV